MQTNAKKRKATQQYSQQEINKELDIINGLKQRIESEDCSLHEREVIAARLEQYKNDLPDNEATSALLQMVNKCQLLLVNFVNTELQNIAEETPTLLETSTTNVQFIAWPRAVELHGKISSLGVIVETLPECDAIEQLKEAIYVQRATCEDICGQCINVALKRATSFSDIESILTHINSQDIELLKNFDYYAELDVIIVCLKNAFKDANAIHDNGTTDESPSSDETLKRLKKDCNFV